MALLTEAGLFYLDGYIHAPEGVFFVKGNKAKDAHALRFLVEAKKRKPCRRKETHADGPEEFNRIRIFFFKGNLEKSVEQLHCRNRKHHYSKSSQCSERYDG